MRSIGILLTVFLLLASVVVVAQQEPAAEPLAAAAGYKAKVLASAIFVSGIDLERAEREDLAPLPGLDQLAVEVDTERRAVTVRLGETVERTALCRDDFGCTLLPAVEGTIADLPSPGKKRPAKRHRWEIGPSNAALDRVVAAELTEPDPDRPRHTRALVVIHDGRIVAERYAEGIGAQTPLNGWSMTKSVINAMTGILVGQERLDPASALGLEAWSGEGDPRGAITVDHLLRMNSGLAFDENYGDPARDVGQMLFARRDAGLFAMQKAADHEPGEHWSYSSGTTNLLSRVLRARAGSDERYVKLAHDALFAPLGMHTAVLEPDASGTFIGSSMMHASARDWARFGQLYLQGGLWQGERILPEGWVDYTTRVTPGSNGRYGAHFWLNAIGEQGTRPFPDLPADYFRCSGFQGQHVGIIPSLDLVVVRLGMTNHGNWSHRELMPRVIAAFVRAE